MKTGLFWFTNDLRIHDNPALKRASLMVDRLLCVYVIDFSWRSSDPYFEHANSDHQAMFLRESLEDLNHSLTQLGQQLIVFDSETPSTLTKLIAQHNITDVFRSDNAGWFENRLWITLKNTHAKANFHSIDTHTLFSTESLPFTVNELPGSFTKFKNALSDIKPKPPIAAVSDLPPQLPNDFPTVDRVDSTPNDQRFRGGETFGIAHLNRYFSSKNPQHYKEVRNAIDGWDNSCKLSPWLANGSLSAREVVATLSDYERSVVANESTYWIYFELLWREFFQWYAQKYDNRLFLFNGIKDSNPEGSYQSERFLNWVNGTTPHPLVNACMNELRETGYVSNRGRQMVASCFVNELAMDWRYGAAYFEQVLIDYDVASNWGNWQYLAGVGADSRDKRHFNLTKQAQQFDPDGRYVGIWNGNT